MATPLRFASFPRLLRTAMTWSTWPRRQVYDSKSGVPRDLLAFIQQDIDFRPNTVRRWLKRKRLLVLKEQQADTVSAKRGSLGPDLAAAHFILNQGGAVKFVNQEKWHRQTKDGKSYIPIKYVEGVALEAIDASNTNLMYVGFDNLIDLANLTYLSVSKCPYVDDWCLARFHQFKDTLQFLDVSGCPRVTERGLATLHNLERLRGVNISDLDHVGNRELLVILMEEMLPDCSIVGVDYTKITESNSEQ